MKDMINKTFTRLTVIQKTDTDKWGKIRWLCQCICGNKIIVTGSKLRNGSTRSCGCLAKDNPSNLKHGHSNTKIYYTWFRMRYRCYNPNCDKYYRYGGRGIKICKRWRKFENFLEDMGEPPTKDHSLDRINNNKNYCKSNCRWATQIEQARNTNSNRRITFEGKTQCITAWGEEMDIKHKIIYRRLDDGWTIKEALTIRPGGKR